MPPRWHSTTLNDQFGTFDNTVKEYSFELTPDTVLTCGALVIHTNARGPLTGGKWGHLFLFPDTSTREHELAQHVHRHRRSTVRRFVLRHPLKSKTLASGVRQLYVLSTTQPKRSTHRRTLRPKNQENIQEDNQEGKKARTSRRRALWARSLQRLRTPHTS